MISTAMRRPAPRGKGIGSGKGGRRSRSPAAPSAADPTRGTSRGATPQPSRGATPQPSRGATPQPRRGAAPQPSSAAPRANPTQAPATPPAASSLEQQVRDYSRNMVILMRSKLSKKYREEPVADLQPSIDELQRHIEENQPDEVNLSKAQEAREALLKEEEAARKTKKAAWKREQKACDETRVARRKVREIQARIDTQDELIAKLTPPAPAAGLSAGGGSAPAADAPVSHATVGRFTD